MTILRRSTSILFAVIGLLCVLFPRQITAALPCVLGGAMAIAGVVCAASCFRGGGEPAAAAICTSTESRNRGEAGSMMLEPITGNAVMEKNIPATLPAKYFP